jgi:bifunctional non-homologous end joining protein LigD
LILLDGLFHARQEPGPQRLPIRRSARSGDAAHSGPETAGAFRTRKKYPVNCSSLAHRPGGLFVSCVLAKRTRLSVKTIDGAQPLEMPGFIRPQLATLKSRAPKGDQWIHEIKFDGYRIQIHLNKGKRKVYTRNGLDWTKRFSVIAGALDIPGQTILDGEVVVVKDGRTNFAELQAELAAGDQDRLIFYAFDLLWRDGDLRKLPQIERKQALLDLLGENGIEAPIVYSEHLTGDGQEMFEHTGKLGWEGIISKNAQAPYRSDRSEAWLKIKTVQRGKFPVIGFVKDPTGVAALYLGKRKGKDLVYMGKVGTGWSRTISSQIRKQLDTVVSPKSKLTKPIRKPKAVWVEPSFSAEVEYRDITSEGLLRQSSFKGLKRS